MNHKYLDLFKRSNTLFNITQKNMKVYKDERKKLYDYTEDKNANLKEWEDFVLYFENLVLESKDAKENTL